MKENFSIMFIYSIFLILIVFIYTNETVAQVTDDESCETLQSEVHITKGIIFFLNFIKSIYK